MKIVIRLQFLCILLLTFNISNGQQSEKSLHAYFENASDLNPIEGIWNVETTREYYHFDTLYNVQHMPGPEKVAIMKNGDVFTATYLSGDSFNPEFTGTDVKGVYMYRNYYPLISDYSKKQAVICTHGKMEYTYDLPDEYVIQLCGEKYQSDTRIVNIHRWKKIFPANP